MTPGPELDRQVAEALGMKTDSIPGICVVDRDTARRPYYLDGNGRPWYRFEPSTDLNDAFYAAEKVDLWNRHSLFLRGNEIWHYGECLMPNAGCCGMPTPWITEDTPALAICAAILKLKEQA